MGTDAAPPAREGTPIPKRWEGPEELMGTDAEPEGDYPCPDCAVELGAVHHLRCDQERCPACGGQLVGCDCHVTPAVVGFERAREAVADAFARNRGEGMDYRDAEVEGLLAELRAMAHGWRRAAADAEVRGEPAAGGAFRSCAEKVERALAEYAERLAGRGK